MIKNKTIVCLASGYDAPPTSKHHVMHLLARDNKVLWVNYHGSRTPTASASDLAYMARKLKQVCSPMRQVRDNLYVLTPPVVPLPGSRIARRINRRLMIGRIRGALKKLGQGEIQLWTFTPDVSYLLGQLCESKVLYYCVDDFASFTGYDRPQVLRDEADLCSRADLVVTTSLALHKAKSPLNPRTILVPHGVDYEHFSAALSELSEPAELAEIPHPRLGFFGLIRDWVDLDLIAQVARARGEWHFVFVGDSTLDLGPYRQLPNMHFLGRRSYQQLPAYCRHMEAGLIPFRMNELTEAVNPIKLREYLAAGLAVVSTPLPEVALYKSMIHLAEDARQWEQAIAQALAQDSPDRRRQRCEAMSRETWPTKLQVICDALEGGSSDHAPRMNSGTVRVFGESLSA